MWIRGICRAMWPNSSGEARTSGCSSMYTPRASRISFLERRKLATADRESGLIGLTRAGKTLVEAIISTEIV